ncbi:MAG: hypothetical protein PHX16_01440 [Syntrophaceticus sp.]|nr:hypothetical protein [Syntrophaceticus sp.]MDD3313993.1 hypothetical protein [Syntrophaceticus sp.]MDD4359302.1 hypothetical protein [Syntrophaceticus sp.]MDD4782295.1 hypothetical protein [Syntrophaceticus sp.]
MLKVKQMQETQDLKLRGYSKSEIVTYYESQGKKPPSRPTINKYYNMDSVPENPNQNLIKDKVFDHEPFRSAIISYGKTTGRIYALAPSTMFSSKNSSKKVLWNCSPATNRRCATTFIILKITVSWIMRLKISVSMERQAVLAFLSIGISLWPIPAIPKEHSLQRLQVKGGALKLSCS